MSKVVQDNESLSNDLIGLQQVFDKTKARCEQQMNIISEVKDTLGSSEAKLKVVGEENEDLHNRLKTIEDDRDSYRAKLHGALEEHAAQSAKAQAKFESALQEQERLRRELANVKKDVNARDIYVTDLDGKLTSREASLSDLYI